MKKFVSILLIITIATVCMVAVFAEKPGSTAVASELEGLAAKSAVIIDQNTGKVIWGKDANERVNPASTTKIMTALLAIENGSMKDTVTIGSEIYFVEADASKAGLVKGEKISLENLIKGLMLPSGGDAAYAVAVYTARKVSKNSGMDEQEAVEYFCKLMNKRAEKAGAKHTHFSNPDGYQDDNHYTTASDLALIAKSAMKYKQFRSIVAIQSYSMKEWKVSKNSKKGSGIRVWKNTNKLLDKKGEYFYRYCTGIKTGYTKDAGHCLVASASKGNKSVIIVAMNSTLKEVWTDSISLLDYGLYRK